MRVVTEQHESDGASGEADATITSAVERGLFKSALDFYGAAEAVIDYRGLDRPRLRFDLERLQSVRAAMGALERRIEIARRAGLSTEQIVGITRLDPEMVERIVARQRERAALVDEPAALVE
ncbi:hypothetical protein VSS74_07495 [Conexibacter stalactiti]|uniref:DNA-binding protein n=1 Tax=Conexibacter stalactiti TaxID=1940611 RepID=A0ABU4HLJ7_9ACTN|nr:hypothetical protein [Conexibacter stalactiti]MDW5594173.1 hypothetical protein [Conexibacter stalactiti]MEC5034815.1 hypothetical protein [Conexibacter stalactiti]